MIILFEGRDAAGKGGSIKRLTEPMNPRGCRVVALGTPSDQQKTQWYFQRYVEHFPSAGEIVVFDRSWYNRAGVERVMGFASEEQVEQFYVACPQFERMLVQDGIYCSSTGSQSTTKSRRSVSNPGLTARNGAGK